MKIACSSCGAQHSLPDAQLVGRPRVQFNCAKCGKPTLVELSQNPDATQILSSLPKFSRSACAPRLSGSVTIEYPFLRIHTAQANGLSYFVSPTQCSIYS